MVSINTVRAQIAENMTETSPMGIALTGLCDEVETLRRGIDALTEQVEQLQEQMSEVGERAGMRQDVSF